MGDVKSIGLEDMTKLATFADAMLSHVADKGHSMTVVTVAKGQPHQQTFLTCMNCGEFGVMEVDLSMCTFVQEFRKEIGSV